LHILREYALLEFLMRHPRQVLSRTQITEHVWDYAFLTTSNVVDVYIRYLRRKIDRGCSVDPDVVTQIVLNLLDNAIKYTPSGRVRLSAHRVKGGSGGIQIAVADSGPGIPAEHLPHIFDRFYRVDRARSQELGGAGLGLAIARELARAHGGDVTVRSSSGEGSTSSVLLPDWPTTQR